VRTNSRRSAAIAAAGPSFRNNVTAAVTIASAVALPVSYLLKYIYFFFKSTTTSHDDNRTLRHGILDPIKRSALWTVHREKISCDYNTGRAVNCGWVNKKKNSSTATDKIRSKKTLTCLSGFRIQRIPSFVIHTLFCNYCAIPMWTGRVHWQHDIIHVIL
jgi:hypothetical protein